MQIHPRIIHIVNPGATKLCTVNISLQAINQTPLFPPTVCSMLGADLIKLLNEETMVPNEDGGMSCVQTK